MPTLHTWSYGLIIEQLLVASWSDDFSCLDRLDRMQSETVGLKWTGLVR